MDVRVSKVFNNAAGEHIEVTRTKVDSRTEEIVNTLIKLQKRRADFEAKQLGSLMRLKERLPDYNREIVEFLDTVWESNGHEEPITDEAILRKLRIEHQLETAFPGHYI